MKTLENFPKQIKGSMTEEVLGFTNIRPRRASGTRLLLRSIVVVLLLCGIPSFSVASETCEANGEVTIAFKGIMCALVPFTVTLNGAVANGPGGSCVGIADSTPKTFTRLKLNKTYQMTAGYAICITTINFEVPEGYTLYIDGQEANQIIKSDALGHAYSGDGTWDIVVRKKCDSGSKGVGQAATDLDSVNLDLSMGLLPDGRSAEGLSIQENALSSYIYTPGALIYSPPGLTDQIDVVRSGDGSVRQVKAPQALADIIVINSSEYDIRYYRPADVGAKVNGLYGVNGQPFVTWKVRNPDPATTNRFQIQKIENGTVTDQTEYACEAITDYWTLSSGWTPATGTYARIKTKTVSYPTQTTRKEVFVVKDGTGQIASKAAKVYMTFPWGDELIQQIADPDGAALTTTYDYYSDPSQDWTYSQLKSVTHSDGSWEKYEYNFQDWSISQVLRPWKDISLDAATAENARATIYHYARHDGYKLYGYYKFVDGIQEQVQGTLVKNQSITRWSAVDGVPITINGEPVVREEVRYYASESLSQATTITRYYYTASPFLANRVANVEYANGRKDTYTYERGNYTPNADPSLCQFTPDANGQAERTTVVHGTITSPDGLAFKTTKEITVKDQNSNNVLQEVYAYTGTTYDRIGWTVSTYDDRGHVTQTIRHTGEISTAVWQGERKLSEIDQNSIELTYTYDALGRVNTSTRKGVAASGGFAAQADITTMFGYDGDGRNTSQAVSAGGLTLTRSTSYDKAGRIQKETNEAGLVTTYSYANGGRKQTVTRPGGATETTERYLDEHLKSITGTAQITRYFDYGVDFTTPTDGTQYTRQFVGSAALNSPRWTKITLDWLGRRTKVERPTFSGATFVVTFVYEEKGQLHAQTTLAGATRLVADQLYEYDDLGNQTRAGLDVDGNGALTPASTDRMTETDLAYENVGNDWFRVRTKRTYLTDNNATPTVEIERERLNNFLLSGSEQTIFDDTVTDVAGNNSRTTTTIDRAAKKETQTIDTPDSNINAVTVSVNGLLQSSSPTTPELPTTYTYDALGRQTGVSNPSSGLLTRTYDPATGRLTSISNPATTMSYEYYSPVEASAGRLKAQTNAANKKVYFNYSSRGELVQTWGDATYPLEYVYDAYGQKIELHTFRAGQNWSAAKWPGTTTGGVDMTRWIYQDATGLLTQKQDAAQKGATYTYDELGRLKIRTWARTDGLGNALSCTYAYHPQTGELTGIDYSDATPDVIFGYDRGGRQKTITDTAGLHTRTFNSLGELQDDQITGGILDMVQVHVSYDQYLGRQSLQATRGATQLSTQTYTYDAASRLETISSGGQTVTYAYRTDNGLLNTTSFTGGTLVARGYDSAGRLQSITTTPAADAPVSYTYEYDNLNQRRKVTREDSSYWSHTYNDRGELISGKQYWADNTPVFGDQSEYDYDTIGNRKTARSGGNELGSLRQSSYSSNSLNQYMQRTVPGAVDIAGTANSAATVTVNSQGAARKSSYFYKELSVDNSAAPVYAQVNVVGAKNNYGAGGEDAVTEKGGRVFVPKALEAYTYDADGNLTSDGRWGYTWDGENRLIAMESIASVPVEAKSKLEFAYDFMGRRLEKKIYSWNVSTSTYALQGTTKFVYDGWNVIAELDANYAPVRTLIWGQDVSGSLQDAGGIGGLLLINEGGATFQAGCDGNGNVTILVNAGTGKLAASYDYDPFGNALKSVGDYAGANPFRFSTKYFDRETDGLGYYGYRYYNSQTGRWLSRDPIGERGGDNLYAFVSNAPSNRIDRNGLYEVDVHYYLTYFLASKNKCLIAKAKNIADADQGTDEDLKTKPEPGWISNPWDITSHLPFLPAGILDTSRDDLEQQGKNAFYHALHPGAVEGVGNPALWRDATRDCGDIKALGQYLHYLQDTFSHAGFYDPKKGHGYTRGHYPDHTISAPPEKTLRMAKATWQALNDYARQTGCCEDEWRPGWDNVILRFAKIGLPFGPWRVIFEGSISNLQLKVDVLDVPSRYPDGL
jgi:RHS repeat-associated protein